MQNSPRPRHTLLGIFILIGVTAGCASQKQVELLQRDLDKMRAATTSGEQLKAVRAEVAQLRAELTAAKAQMTTAAAALKPKKRPGRLNRPNAETVYSVPVEHAAMKGKADAWITVVEVSDFQCPFCKRVGPALQRIQEKYGDDVRFAFKHNALSFHKRAKPAAMAAECAGEQNHFWTMHDLLFESQQRLGDADLESYAAEIPNFDLGKWKLCFAENRYAARIDADQQEVVALGALGTPSFFINGRFLAGAQPFARFEALIDEELKKAKASGIARENYYQLAVVAKGRKKL